MEYEPSKSYQAMVRSLGHLTSPEPQLMYRAGNKYEVCIYVVSAGLEF